MQLEGAERQLGGHEVAAAIVDSVDAFENVCFDGRFVYLIKLLVVMEDIGPCTEKRKARSPFIHVGK